MGSGAVRPSGTVTFLFTDIEGSTARWEAAADAMRTALVEHDEELGRAIESRGGWVFKHTGDGVCAAFRTPGAAVEAAIAAQCALRLPVRMGIATGEAEPRGDDYFGPVLNRVARVMAAGHGGQILVAESTAALIDGVELLDLGERRLRDLSGPQRVFQVVAPGLEVEFDRLRTLDSLPGNLPEQATSFMGRERDVGEITALVREHRLVTLIGVGGVGKTRLALQVAAELAEEFVDGVWLVELAEVGDPGAVPDAVATALGLTPQPAMSVTESVVQSLVDRRALVVLDNCEHVLDAAADLVEAVRATSPVVRVLVTSREGMRLAGEHVWSVPSLDVRAGLDSEAVGLFVERAQAVDSGFTISDDSDASAVVEICERLDGIALAIELAAARMASMAPSEVCDRLGDRFRLLAGGRRGLERHQTLRHAVQWSYELLDDDESVVLNRCAVFAGGFDLRAAIDVAGAADVDEYGMLDLLASLVRKSLLTVSREHGHTRYAMLETIRQFAEDQLAAAGEAVSVRDRHARHFAHGAALNFERYYTPDQSQVVDWCDSELANLRAGFRWGIQNGDLDAAAAIAGRIGWLGVFSQNFEPAGWCIELLESPNIAQHRLLKWLYMGAAGRSFVGDADTAIGYSETGLALPKRDFDEVPHELDRMSLALAKLFAGQPEQYAAITLEISTSPDDHLVMGSINLVWILPALDDFDQALDLADDMLARAEATEVPSQVAQAHSAYGRALTRTDPTLALEHHRTAVRVARENNLRLFAAVFGRELAGLEARDGDVRTALESLDQVIDTFHQTGDAANLAPTLAYLPMLFDRTDHPIQAATLYGAAARHPSATMNADLDRVTHHLRTTLGVDGFDEHVAHGATMTLGQAVSYARAEIAAALDEITETE